MRKSISVILLLLTALIITKCNAQNTSKDPKVKPGIDVLLEQKFDIISGKQVGLITNSTGMTSNLISTIDALHNAPSVKLTALFGPEHGVRGDIEGGYKVPQYIDEKTGVTVYSLYGETRKPTPEMLKNIDVLIYDIQDIGSRAYTFIYTMALAMEAAKENGILFTVLDRPNPLGGNLVEGKVLDPKFSSFIGMYPIPYIYGMTVGELAELFNNEFKINCNLNIVPMQGWKRDMLYEDTGLIWIPPSPHVPHAEVSFFVATTGCLGELHTVSEGVGYTSPFEIVGAPWIQSDKLAWELNSKKLSGVYFRPIHFKPYYERFAEQQCQGVQIHIIDKKTFLPAATQIHIISTINKLYPGQKIFDTKRITSFDKANGTDQVRLDILNGIPAEKIISSWENDLNEFLKIRKRYLIYQ